ncbi:uncharacterized protein LOC135209953 [Macrobrachium nipponense]|uniref:uncharacterized protein LOC135209953 n=1 Tax=Macrobrachium nipponense TaxID=159736 RepID=UPI0030C812FA
MAHPDLRQGRRRILQRSTYYGIQVILGRDLLKPYLPWRQLPLPDAPDPCSVPNNQLSVLDSRASGSNVPDIFSISEPRPDPVTELEVPAASYPPFTISPPTSSLSEEGTPLIDLGALASYHVPQGLAFQKRQEPLSPITKGPLRGIAPPVPITGPADLNSLPVPLGSTEQCQALSSLDVEPPQTLTSVPGPKLVPAPNLTKDTPTGDHPTGMELTTAHGQSQVHESSSTSPLSTEDEPQADLTFTPPLDDQELPDQESA